MTGNPHHPKKGSIITSDPLTSFEQIQTLKEYLAARPGTEGKRDAALFSFAINVAYRASDLLSLRVGQLRHLSPGDTLTIREQKTRKVRPVTLNRAAHAAIQPLMEGQPDDAYLFRSQRGGPLTVGALGNKVKEWCSRCGFKGNFSSHTLRKTFGRMQVVEFGVPVYVLTEILQHSSPAVTLRYVGLQAEDVAKAYENCL